MSDILLHRVPLIASCLLYALLGWHFWRTRWRPLRAGGEMAATRPWERLAILLALALQGVALYDGLFGAGGMRFSFSFAASLMLWLAVLIYWLENFRSRMDGLQAMVMPLAAVGVILTSIFPNTHLIAHTASWAFRLHFLAGMLAYSLFTLAALHAVFMGIAERNLHRARLNQRFISLPPLLAMESMLFRMIGAGFLLLTLALGSGIVFSEDVFGRAAPFTHKTVFALLSWGIFAALLIGRRLRGWRGRIALRWTLAGFLALFLAYIGSRFISEVILGRI